jgi:uncharacterized protein YkwD
MNRSLRLLWPALLLALCCPSPATAQLREAHETELLTQEALGPFRPKFDPDLEAVARQIIEMTNDFRRDQDREPVTTNSVLMKTTQDFADYMARTGRYGHNADGRQPSERADAHGYEYCVIAENIAYQFRTRGYSTDALAERFVTGWEESPGHRANMLDPAVTETGVGVAQGENGVYYAVQMFGRPKSMHIEFRITNRSGEDVRYQVGERTYTLQPRFIRTHQVCRPPDVTFLLPSEGDKPQRRHVDVDSGDSLLVTGGPGGGIQVQRQGEV